MFMLYSNPKLSRKKNKTSDFIWPTIILVGEDELLASSVEPDPPSSSSAFDLHFIDIKVVNDDGEANADDVPSVHPARSSEDFAATNGFSCNRCDPRHEIRKCGCSRAGIISPACDVGTLRCKTTFRLKDKDQWLRESWIDCGV